MSHSASSQPTPPAQSAIPRFAAAVPTAEAVQQQQLSYGLSSNSSSASAPCFVPSIGTGHAQRDTSGGSKQFKQAMNSSSNGICDISNNSGAAGCHNGHNNNIDKYAAPKKSHLPGNYFSSTNRNRNSALSYPATKTPLSLTGNSKLPVDQQILTSKGQSNRELNSSSDSSRISSLLPYSALPITGQSGEVATGKGSLNTLNRARTNSLPSSSNSHLSESSPSSAAHQDVGALNHLCNLPVYSTVDSVNCVQNHIATKLSLSAQANSSSISSKMTQPTKVATHPLRLIKSQSLKFDNHHHNTSNSAAHLCAQKAKSGEASKSLDTVDNLDLYSCKLPRSLTLSNKAISPKMASNNLKDDCELLFDDSDLPTTDQTPGSLSRSSTASLGVLSNLNDVLAAANIPDDCSDEDIDDLCCTRLSAIDESLSPLPSIDSMSFIAKDTALAQHSLPVNNGESNGETVEDLCQEQDDEGMMFHKSEIATSDIENDINANNVLPAQEIISLHSIDTTEPSAVQELASEKEAVRSETTNATVEMVAKSVESIEKEGKSIANKSDNRPLTDKNLKKTAVSKPLAATPARPSTLSKFSVSKVPNRNAVSSASVTTRQDPSAMKMSKAAATTAINGRRVEFNVVNQQRKQSSTKSSLPSSSNASRTSTPALSESETGELNSLCSNSSALSFSNALSSKLSLQPSLTNQRLTQRALTNSNSSVLHKQMADKSRIGGKSISSKPNSQAATLSSITRSSTYTRSLNTAPNRSTAASRNETKTKSSNGKTESQANEPQRKAVAATFTKPTASYLKKTTTKPVSSGQASLPKRPSSVASNASTASHSVPSTGTTAASTLRSKAHLNAQPSTASPHITRSPALSSTAKRSPTITLLSSAAAASCKSAQSSRRSSIASSSKASTPTTAGYGRKEDTSASKPTAADLSQQLRYYQALCVQRANQVAQLEATMKHSTTRSSAFLALSAHLINEYAPFDTPKLRAELASVHHKAFLLHRDCELFKESGFQKDNTIGLLNNRLSEALTQVDCGKNEISSLKEKLTEVEQELLSTNEERARLEEATYELQQELCLEKETRLGVETRLEQLELSCRSDKKYRDLKEKVSTYQMEVDSLNVVVDLKTQRTRHLEGEIMRIELELSNYENLKESYQRLQRENEALTETLGMKARKNAEQSREIEHLRSEMKREANERKRTSIRNDQLEYQLNETREMLADLSFVSELAPDNNDCENNKEDVSRFNSFSSAQRPASRHYVRRLFSTPSMSHDTVQSRQHFQHQDPVTEPKHRLPELVLSSIGANWSLSGRPPPPSSSSGPSFRLHHNTHDPVPQADSNSSKSSNCSNNSSPLTSPGPIMSNSKSDTFSEFPTNVSTPTS